MKRVSRYLFGLLIALTASMAQAIPLITFTDTNLFSGPYVGVQDVQNDTAPGGAHWAVQWTQTVATTNVTLTADLGIKPPPGDSGPWYVTTTLGAGTTAANVVYSGTYSPPALNAFDFNFNDDTRTVLGTGLSFGPGTYYLVLSGPPGLGPLITPVFLLPAVGWVGDASPTVDTAPGFSVGSYFKSTATDSFAPASTFVTVSGGKYVFEQEGTLAATEVPEPGALSLLLAGLAAFGGTGRLSRRVTARLDDAQALTS